MTGRPVNLLFVCTANVCRSPLAAGLMAAAVVEPGARVRIASASIDREIRPTHETTLEMLAARQVTLGRRHSQPLDEALIAAADLVLVMTTDHAKTVVGRFPGERHKVFLLRHLVHVVPPAGPGESTDQWLDRVYAIARDYSRDEQWDVEDPMGAPDSVYRAVETQLDEATTWLANVLASLR